MKATTTFKIATVVNGLVSIIILGSAVAGLMSQASYAELHRTCNLSVISSLAAAVSTFCLYAFQQKETKAGMAFGRMAR